MTNFKKKKGLVFTAAAMLLCYASCVEVNYNIGSGLMPQTHNYDIYTITVPLDTIYMSMADSLSGYSSSRITIGSIRDEDYGLSTRSCALTLVPLFQDSLVIGTDPEPYYFHFAAAKDTVSYSRADQEWIFQTFKVYELEKPLDPSVDYDCNKPLTPNRTTSIAKNSVIYTGDDSLSFNFTDAFAKKFLELDSEVFNDIDTYFEKFPGIYIECSDPTGNGGRINMFELQLGYDSDYYYFTGNYARLSYSAEFDGERRDTVLLFYYGVTDFYDVDSLLTNSGTGSFPQYSLNLTSHNTSDKVGMVSEKIYVEGGGGLKPKISAKLIKRLTEDAIIDKGGDPKTAIINKAKVILPFEFPDDYTEMDMWPDVLAPTCRIIYDTIATFANLSDTSDEYADLGDINRSTLRYSPDITYHVQTLIQIDEDNESSLEMQRLNDGSYDVWFLIMANEVTETTTSGSSDLSEYYSYLAYQSYYSDMYSYGSSYSSYYSNYYTYAMLAALYGSSSTSEVTSLELDKDRYYRATLNGSDYYDEDLRPMLQLTFAIPKEEVE